MPFAQPYKVNLLLVGGDPWWLIQYAKRKSMRRLPTAVESIFGTSSFTFVQRNVEGHSGVGLRITLLKRPQEEGRSTTRVRLTKAGAFEGGVDPCVLPKPQVLKRDVQASWEG